MTRWASGKDLATGAEMAKAAEAWSDLFGIATTPSAPVLDPVGELPIVTPETWHGVKGGCGFCQLCPVCSWFKVVSATVAADDHRDGQAASKPHEPAPTRWRSVPQALQTSVTSGGRLEAGSSFGAQLEELSTYGVSVQRERSRGSTSRSDDFAEVEKALAVAVPPGSYEGLSRDQAMTAVMLRVVGTWRRQPNLNAYGRPWSKREKVPHAGVAERFEISEAALTRLIKRAMHGLRVELGARGLTPMPAMGSRAHHEAHARRDMLGKRRGGQ